MWFDIAKDINEFDILFLFSWDWDFKYIVDELINKHNKKVFIFSTKLHIAWELVNYTQNFDKSICRFFDINNDKNTVSKEIKENCKDYEKWIIIFKELLELIEKTDNKEIKSIIDYYKWILSWNYIKPPISLKKLKNKNNMSINQIIIRHWKKEEKELLVQYLENIIS